ncbi:hypothetical protein ACF0H5_002866 [Mactra antiquata]
MNCYHSNLIHIFILLMMTDKITSSLMCKFSNENCDGNDECCSRRCVKLHEGTNARCASSTMHYPCIYEYHCEDGLACGDFYSCCAPFWGVCADEGDCCDETHVCREETGFVYNRCLPEVNESNQVPVSSCILLSVILPAHFLMRVIII